MRIIQSAVFRAAVAIMVGVLLVKYREDTMKWLTIVAGILFFLSGIITLVGYSYERNKWRKAREKAQTPENREDTTPSDASLQAGSNVPVARAAANGKEIKTQGKGMGNLASLIVGLGSTILGIILALIPVSFIIGVTYVLASMLIIGAIQQFVNLITARRYASIPLIFWLFPLVTLAVGILVVIHPMETATLPLKIIGWAMMFYGVVECINAMKIHAMRKQFLAAEEASVQQGVLLEEAEAEIIED